MKNHLTTSLVLALAAPAVLAQCPISAPGVQEAAPPVDAWSGVIPLQFAFPFAGATYNNFLYSDHGVIALGTVVPPINAQLWDPGSQPNTSGQAGGGFAGFGADVICAYWGDHTSTGFGSLGQVWIDSRPTHCTITWLDNEPYINFTAGAFTAQVTLFPNGEIKVCLDGRCNNTSSTFGALTTVIGVYQNGSAIPAASDFSTNATVVADETCFEEFLGPGPANPNTPDPGFDLGDTTLTFIPASPGWVVQADALVCASTATVGAGCAGLALASTSTPVLGMSWDLELSGVTSPFPNFIAFGNAIPATPVGLLFPSLFPATCNAYMGAEFGLVDIGAAAGGVAAYSLPIPLDATLKGATLTGQGVSLQLAGPPFGLSDGQTGTLGY